MPDSLHSVSSTKQPSIVFGVTSAQSCLVLRGRLRAFRLAGWRVTVVSSPGPLLTTVAAEEGVEAVAIPIERRIACAADLVSFFRLWRLLGRLKPDLVEFGTPKAGLLGLLAARLRGIPRRVYLLRGLKLETCTGLKRQLLRVAERLAASCAHGVLCNSPSLRQKAGELGIASEKKLLLLGAGSTNGVDLERFSPGPSPVRARLGIPPRAPVVGFVGRLTCDKGIPELADAFEQILARVPEAWLLLVGWFDQAEDALPESLYRRIEAHPRMVVTGFVEDTELYLRAMDVLVLPTRREGFPNAVLEASAVGIPVVTTTATGARDAVVPGETGVLIPPGNAAALCEAVLPLLADPEDRTRLGNAGRAWAERNFARKRVLDQTEQLYRKWIEPSPARSTD